MSQSGFGLAPVDGQVSQGGAAHMQALPEHLRQQAELQDSFINPVLTNLPAGAAVGSRVPIGVHVVNNDAGPLIKAVQVSKGGVNIGLTAATVDVGAIMRFQSLVDVPNAGDWLVEAGPASFDSDTNRVSLDAVDDTLTIQSTVGLLGSLSDTHKLGLAFVSGGLAGAGAVRWLAP